MLARGESRLEIGLEVCQADSKTTAGVKVWLLMAQGDGDTGRCNPAANPVNTDQSDPHTGS